MKPLGNPGGKGWNFTHARTASSFATVALTLALSLSDPLYSATNTVTSLADSGAGSLRQVIANSGPGDTIVFSVTGVIALSGTELVLDRDLTLNGPGASTLAITANYASRVFKVATNVSASLSGLTIRDGRTPTSGDPGGGIYNAGTLSVQSCVVSNNAALTDATGAGLPGGGIYNLGALVLKNSTISFNRTAAGANGVGGYDNGGSGSGGGDGGAIWNGGDLSANLCLFSDNAAGGGGSGSSGRVIGGSGGGGGDGGAIYSRGTMTLTGCTVSNNTCGYGGYGASGQANGGQGGWGGAGGGIHTADAVLIGCTIVSNRAGSGGGGASAMTGGNGGSGGGGGGIYGWGMLVMTNCTVAGNVTGGGGTGGLPSFGPVSGGNGGSGGGLYCATNLALVACTIVNNTASPGGSPGWGGGFGSYGATGHGGGVCGAGLSLNSIVALNSGQGSNVFGVFNSLGNNLVSTTNGATGFGAPGDLAGSDASPLDPKVGPVAGYGGPTVTAPLLAGSPAIDQGAAFGIPATDQRGVARPQGRGADIGAFEFQFTIPQITGAKWQSSSDFWLQSCGLPNSTYKLQFSTNLLYWSDRADLLTGPNGVNEFTDSGLDGFTARFYRLKSVSP